jgi:hypothetical protein
MAHYSDEPPFPEPEWFPNRRRRWRLSKLRGWEAALNGEPPPDPLPPHEEQWLSRRQVEDRYSVSRMWIWRRLHLREDEAA